MKAAKTWCIASVAVLAALSSASCGKDEADGAGTAGSGMVLTGGSGGTGGAQGRGGQSPTAGNGGTASGTATKLGRGCMDDDECADTKAPGLKCITETDTVLGDGAPPKGLCTAECTSNEECAELGVGSRCVAFEDNATSGYCMEGCTFGERVLGDPEKCHDRPEFVCSYAGPLEDTGDACSSTRDDCNPGELCSAGTCQIIVPLCVPSCRGDIDCAEGMFCDMAFLTGVCRTEKVAGKGLGEPCTMPAEGEPSEPDECVGFCQADDATNTTGHCAATCSIGGQCGWNPSTEKFDGACAFETIFDPGIGDLGDIGFCAGTCDCASDCDDEALGCFTIGEGQLLPKTIFRGAGLCLGIDPANPDEPQYDMCTGTGGTGGVGAGGAGGEGAGGEGATSQGGAPGEGGTGGAP